MDELIMIFGSHGWHWLGIWKRFVKKSKIGGNLELVSKWHFGLTKLSNGQRSGQSGQHKSCSS
jgi:hypothetical protein